MPASPRSTPRSSPMSMDPLGREDDHEEEDIVEICSPTIDGNFASFDAASAPMFELDLPIFSDIASPYHRRALLHHFTSELSTLMTFTGDIGNPFRELVLPLCKSSKAVLSSVLALSCAHLELKGIENKETSISLHTQALHFLGEALKGPQKRHEIVTTILMLIYYEAVCLGSHIDSQSID